MTFAQECYKQWRERTMDGVYVDQAPYRGMCVFACDTPEGIRMRDTDFCNRIQKFAQHRTQKTYLSLKKEIEDNAHLHNKIKQNLLLNLNRIWNE